MSKALDISIYTNVLSAQTFVNLKNTYNYEKVVVEAWTGTAQASNCYLNLRRAVQAGLAVDAYCFLRFASNRTAIEQVDRAIQACGPAINVVGTMWIDVETYLDDQLPSKTKNRASVEDAIQEVKDIAGYFGLNVQAGIYSSQSMWEQCVGTNYTKPAEISVPLWYAHDDKISNCSDWTTQKFGGWSRPVMKQFDLDIAPFGFDMDDDWICS